MTLQQLRYVIKIVECGSITEAAKRLYISQPSLSNAVRELENDMGIEIFSRSAKGISLTSDGMQFMSYARQVCEQVDLLEERYKNTPPTKQLCCVSTQHYSFAVKAFAQLIKECNADEYEFSLREKRTFEIIEDVKNLNSELGVIYLSAFNEKVMTKILRENHLVFSPLFVAEPHVFISRNNPLAKQKNCTLDDLEDYPCLSFEQGSFNSFYFSEEILSTVYHRKSIKVTDRATLFNMLIGVNGYTISTGVLSQEFNGEEIISIPLQTDEKMQVGWIKNSKAELSKNALRYVELLKQSIL